MFRLSRVTLALIVVLAFLILVIRLGIGGREMSRFSLLFTNPDGSPCQRPCLFGIRMEGMTFSQVQSVLQTHPVLRSRNFGGGISAAYTTGAGFMDIDLAYGYGSVRPVPYTFSDVINVLGAPSYATFNPNSGCIDLYFLTDQLVISNWATATAVCDASHFDAANRVYRINLFGQDLAPHIQTLKPWHGFGDPQQYTSPDSARCSPHQSPIQHLRCR